MSGGTCASRDVQSSSTASLPRTPAWEGAQSSLGAQQTPPEAGESGRGWGHLGPLTRAGLATPLVCDRRDEMRKQNPWLSGPCSVTWERGQEGVGGVGAAGLVEKALLETGGGGGARPSDAGLWWGEEPAFLRGHCFWSPPSVAAAGRCCCVLLNRALSLLLGRGGGAGEKPWA